MGGKREKAASGEASVASKSAILRPHLPDAPNAATSRSANKSSTSHRLRVGGELGTGAATRKDAIVKFMKAYRESIDWLYSSDDALKVYSEWINMPVEKLRRTRDEYFSKAAVDPDKIIGVDIIAKDAVALKFTATELTKEQLAELIQIPPR